MTPQASFDTMGTMEEFDSDEDEEEERQKGQRRRVNLPPMRQKLTGHRNARTMIKVTASLKILISLSNVRRQRGGGRTSSSLVQTVATSLPGIATLESASPC